MRLFLIRRPPVSDGTRQLPPGSGMRFWRRDVQVERADQTRPLVCAQKNLGCSSFVRRTVAGTAFRSPDPHEPVGFPNRQFLHQKGGVIQIVVQQQEAHGT